MRLISGGPCPSVLRSLQFTVSSGQQCCWGSSVIPDFLSCMSPAHCFVAILTVKWRNGVLKALLSCIPGQPLDSTNSCKTKRTFLCIFFIFSIFQQHSREEAYMCVSLFWAPCQNDVSSTGLNAVPPPLWELWTLAVFWYFLYVLHSSSQLGRGALHHCSFLWREIHLPAVPMRDSPKICYFIPS